MKTKARILNGGAAALASLAVSLSLAQAQQDGATESVSEEYAVASPPKKPKNSRDALLETSIPQLNTGDKTSLSDVIQVLSDMWDIQLNAVYRDDAGEIRVPALSLRNVSVIDLLEVLESLTDVSTDIIGNSPKTEPVIVFRGPKKPPLLQQRATGTSGVRQAQSPGSAAVQRPMIVQPAEAAKSVQPILGEIPQIVRQIQVNQPQPVDTGTFVRVVRVFPLSKFDVKPEDIIDFIDQVLTLGVTPKDQKVAPPRTLFHTGTKSLIVRGNAVQVSEIEEALRQLSPDAFAASHLPGSGASTSKDAMKGVRRLFTPKAPTPTHAPDPFGDGDAGAAAADPFGTPKKPAKTRPKAAKDPFGGGPAPGGSSNPFAPAENNAEKPARKAADPFG